ncbi:peptidase M50 [Candidatus Omnitrophus magneticus]|uniref:Peptidase M50 n=1 Tax=Candidatus Omnitrophus magneticus TaxID=1609969 RepID=A0A0F0CNQ5_9BACT|nr:peptidase M50 [Candidatus Omnitrophus magneticus]
MNLTQLLIQNPPVFFMMAIPLFYSVIIHEIAHGVAAYLFGDNTAKQAGRLTLNPLPHIDPMGLLALFIAGFGWAKPIPVDYFNLKNFKLGMFAVSIAGCLANFLLAAIAVLLLKIKIIESNYILYSMLLILAKINMMLCAFNLIPIPPLDGAKIVTSLLPFKFQLKLAELEHYGFIVLFFLLFTGILSPVIIFMQKMIFSVVGILI